MTRGAKALSTLKGCGLVLLIMVVLLAVGVGILLVTKEIRYARYEDKQRVFMHFSQFAERGDIEGMRQALTDGLDVNIVSPEHPTGRGRRWTLLHEAATRGQKDMVQFLIENGANVHAAPRGTFTPLECVLSDSPEAEGVRKALDEKGASKDEVMTRYRDVVRILIDAGALERTPSWYGGPGYALYLAAELGDKPIIEMILAGGVTAEDRGYALPAAVGPGDLDIFDLLRPESVPVKDLNKALYSAACGGNVPTAERLLALGADVNNVQGYQDTPLHGAAKAGRVAVIKCLLNHGANVHAEEREGLSPLEYALRNLADYGVTYGIKALGLWPKMSEAEILEQFRAVVKTLVEAGSLDRRFMGGTGLKILVYEAGRLGDEDILRLVLSTGATPEERGRGLEGLAYTGREDLIQMLCPADIPQQSLDRALYNAALRGREAAMVERLLDLGENVNNTEGSK